MDCLREVIEKSDYSAEVKSNYEGSLVTRVESLTTGLNGQIFVANEIDDKKLFEENTIIDLSRVGSAETKSIIMGILIIRLQEIRLSAGGINLPLKHVTILEEAHNLLKKTSTEQSDESSNLTGRSVEMISSAIAEMRSFGEGFIIVDQAPGLLDMSAIRNTNIKIIMHLPDLSDRELAGRAIGLNDEQIVELSKLPSGVAAIYQNNWVEPVLCKIDYYEVHQKEYRCRDDVKSENQIDLITDIVKYLISNLEGTNCNVLLDKLIQRVTNCRFKATVKKVIIYVLKLDANKDSEEYKNQSSFLISNLIETDPDVTAKYDADEHNFSISNYNNFILSSFNLALEELEEDEKNAVLKYYLYYKCFVENKSEENMKYFQNWLNIMNQERGDK